ncbi:MAG: CRISPR-associated endonuclease Cas2 [Candidatus Aenigmarchaeota archaeon]|nr:CRISPR-associated endonuclease Cas2 [Candidatus Aenigmarchaeota archaeon]MDW8149108.1 CRISPR-associated endonuclease Cas2 [Candidatus Aenigmarchaeota archaeon]
MYLIIAYDVNVARVNKVKKFLRKYLHWVQNSVFEGEATQATLEEIKIGLKEIIDEGEDMVVIYKFRSVEAFKKEIIGVEKGYCEEII